MGEQNAVRDERETQRRQLALLHRRGDVARYGVAAKDAAGMAVHVNGQDGVEQR
ncbi:hypothetical protein [Variovorax ginsengisoli]|uniref:Uncharacterized protein n=1 Tax=Variovorax ginsengisoli TaxID=363844 RepID=A0ABT9S4S0_9BURK|nr:hypothetical protein [Variovorax ginsengisoli]MDP9899353.1 hypothetical protein [Variovorax ginsengisoli]